MRTSYVQDPVTGKLVPKSQYEAHARANAPAVADDLEPFVSPVDGSVIGSRRALREHNKRHDVVQHREYGENEGRAYFEQAQKARFDRMVGNTSTDRQERVNALKRAMGMD